jgi:hypothetical protein
MNTVRAIGIRLVGGLLLASGLSAGLFALTVRAIPSWGATAEEVARVMPGDELTSHPTIRVTNAISIDAPPDAVWPWIAQIGDSRGGFYSYTFIENRIGALTNTAGYHVTYTNADVIHPEWQNPTPGTLLIQGMLQVREIVPERHYLLAESAMPEVLLWPWVWQLEPLDGGARTRLVSRYTIEGLGAAATNSARDFVFNLGGFVMHHKMLLGIKLRAEGGREPGWMQPLEIGLWLTALLCGVAAALLFLLKPARGRPLGVAALSVVVIFGLTFAQPPILLRLLLDAGLLGGLAWAARGR